MISTLPKPLFANLNWRASMDECSKSSPSKPSGSRNAVLASSNETSCFSWLCLDFVESYSNIIMYILNTFRGQGSISDEKKRDRTLFPSYSQASISCRHALLTPIRKNIQGICGFGHHMTGVTDILIFGLQLYWR